MKLSIEDILGICPDFVLGVTADGKPGCKFKRQNICMVPGTSRFVCKLDTFKVRAEPHISMSSTDTFLACPQKYALQYIDRVRPPIDKGYFWLGKALHDCIGRIEKGMPYVVPRPTEADNTSVKETEIIILEEYLEWYRVHQTEMPIPDEYEVPFRLVTPKGRVVVGFIDGMYMNRGVMIERKYAQSDYDKLKTRRQLSIYFAGNPEGERAQIVVYTKHSIKPLKNEKDDMDAFRLRVRAKIEEAGVAGNVKVSDYLRSEFPIEQEIAVLDVVTDMVELCRKNGVFPSYYFACDMLDGCAFREICKYGGEQK